MTQKSGPVLPATGGSYTRVKGGALKCVENPTKERLRRGVEHPVERPVKAPPDTPSETAIEESAT